MNRKQPTLLISIMLISATIACQAGGDMAATPAVTPLQPATGFPSLVPATPTIRVGDDMRTIFPSFSLTENNAVCITHSYTLALSCLDSSGWQVYKNEYDEVSHPRSTIPNRMFGCPDGRFYLQSDTIYRVEGEVLVDIGGYIDLGSLACGSGDGIWVNDYSEIRHFDGSTWTSYALEEYLGEGNGSISDINSMAVAPNGDVWVTTNDIIATFDGTAWKTLTLPGNYSFPNYFGRSQGLAFDSSGIGWVIAYPETGGRQVLRFNGTEWNIFPGPDDDSNGMKSITVDPEGEIWAATTGHKLFTLDPETGEWDFRFDVQKIGMGRQLDSINGMKFDGQGRLWVITNYGLGIYDGAQWTTYHVYNANLYGEDITNLTIIGAGSPQLPAWQVKAPGSIAGKLVSKTQASFTDVLVEACVDTADLNYTGETACAEQAFHALGTVNADGTFVIPNVPVGTYYLYVRISNKWGYVGSEELVPMISEGPIPLTHPHLTYTVKEGEVTQTGEISVP